MLTLLALAACSEPEPSAPSTKDNAPVASAPASEPARHPPAPSGPTPAAAAGKSVPTCTKGLAFDLAKDWKPRPVPDDTKEFDVAGNHPVCEVDGKPAGLIGFMRVYVSPKQPQAALEAQVGTAKATYSEVTVGRAAGVEAVWTDTKGAPVRAFAVQGGTGSVLLVWGGLDAEEHEGGRPAYELAKRTAVPL
ncbi:hypothetical protein Val02_43550 [Virgisporangium aliadipatigenens]|uniref:Uncharacterized protein n=2 Tax=Virgisporangium aliadipatigenens TaxID=741659 RepID=A0A8J4DRB3_9ACTN|nr:hypothetical protein Val02_43550 [Virgisporangium aliadipatigenens]